MGLAYVDLWGIVDESEAPPPFNVDLKVKKKYQRCVKKAMSIIVLDLADNQLVHIRTCKRTSRGMNDPLQHPRDKELVAHIFFRLPQVFPMQDGQM